MNRLFKKGFWYCTLWCCMESPSFLFECVVNKAERLASPGFQGQLALFQCKAGTGNALFLFIFFRCIGESRDIEHKKRVSAQGAG